MGFGTDACLGLAYFGFVLDTAVVLVEYFVEILGEDIDLEELRVEEYKLVSVVVVEQAYL